MSLSTVNISHFMNILVLGELPCEKDSTSEYQKTRDTEKIFKRTNYYVREVSGIILSSSFEWEDKIKDKIQKGDSTKKNWGGGGGRKEPNAFIQSSILPSPTI